MRGKIMDIRTATITEKGQICIPRAARRQKGFKEGSRVSIIVLKDRIELMPMEMLEKMYPMLMSQKSLAKDWLSKDDEEAWKDL